MKSIRLSLIVYFLVLLTGALAGVSWFSYETTAQALHQQKLDSQKLIEAQCETQVAAAHTALDRRLVRQAHAMLNKSQSMFVHAEGLSIHFGVFGAATLPSAHANIALWLERSREKLAIEVYRASPINTYIEELDDDLVADPDHDFENDYFQTYRANGVAMQRSELMGDLAMALPDSFRQMPLLTEHFDDAELKPGLKVRRLTLRTPVQKYDVINIERLWKGVPGPYSPFFFPKAPAKGPNQPKGVNPPKGGKGGVVAGGWQRPTVFPATVPTIFIQYASNLGPLQKKIAGIEKERDDQLAGLDVSITRELDQLRTRMFWISVVTLLAIWLGGFGVIQLGLAPLSKMSDAVSKISPRNFHLSLETSKLPHELRPIATRLKETLEHLQKAFAREKQAAADISHELRTPLAALMTTLEVALRKNRSADEYRDILGECRGSGQHMYQLVERILKLARLDAGADQYRPDEVDVVDIALSCADMIRPLAKAKGLDLRLNLPEPIITQTDPDKLREVLVNLLHNAIEYNKPDGSIDMAVVRTNGQVRLEVRDTGIGIPAEALEHIFERFYRGDPSRHADTPHAGLGLSIVKCYVELMGGTIKVQSSADGTTFTIELPYVAPVVAAETGVQAAHVMARR